MLCPGRNCRFIIIIIITPIIWRQYSIPTKWNNYAVQYNEVQKSSWNEPYSSSFTKTSCSKMALYCWISFHCVKIYYPVVNNVKECTCKWIICTNDTGAQITWFLKLKTGCSQLCNITKQLVHSQTYKWLPINNSFNLTSTKDQQRITVSIRI